VGKLASLVQIIKGWLGGKGVIASKVAFAPQAKSITERLLQESYLPTQRPQKDELPPVISTKTLTPAVASKLAALLPKKCQGYDAVEYRLTRADGQIRASHIPHPLAYSNLVLCIEKHWGNFPDILNNRRSYIRPRFHADGRLIIMKYESWLTKTLKSLGWKLRARYVAQVDISNFFPSIYTHSFGWAIAGMQAAKKSGGKQWYDEVDRALRLTKRNETNGVLIGPATSNIITEAILYNIDEKLTEKGYLFYRHIDDYKCYCSTREDADSFISDISRFLSYYKLSINSKKSQIVTLPASNVDPWVAGLRVCGSLRESLVKVPGQGRFQRFSTAQLRLRCSIISQAHIDMRHRYLHLSR